MADWGYCQHNGPHKWYENYPIAHGTRQSPIDINEVDCYNDYELNKVPLHIDYQTRGKMLINTGAGWKVNVETSAESLLEGGPLNSKYKLEQFHVHWGKMGEAGSEHTINGKSYAAELHLVHWNCEKYSSFIEALDKEDGLAVLGIFLDVGEDSHFEIEKICELMEKIPHSGDSCLIESDLNPTNFLPEKRAYWTYPGSLTTPPLLESVQWIVFKQSIQISEKQLNTFRSLRSYKSEEPVPSDEHDGRVLTNFRPALGRGERIIRNCESD